MSANDRRLRQGYWLRQLGVLLGRGHSMDEALAQLVKVGEEDAAVLQALASYHSGNGRLAGFSAAEPLPPRLLQLLDKVAPKQEAMSLVSYAELQQRIEAPAEVFFSRLQAMAGYFSALAIFMLLLVNFIVQMILGPFSEMFASFGASLPTPTAWLLGLHGQADLIMLISAVLLLLILAAVPALRMSLRRRQGFPAMLRLMPFVGAARHAFHDAEAIHFTQMLVRAGVPYEKALFIAIQMVGGSHGLNQLEPLLGHAAQLGGINEELAYQSGRLLHEFEHRARQALQRLMISAYLLIGLLIGFVVVAAYLPIFSMGGVI
jgi:type II secretory pathway component PulF